MKNLKEFKEALGEHLSDDLLEDIRRDQEERATMSMLLPPQMINTMEVDDLRDDRVRRYMAPALSDRETEWAVATRWPRATPCTRPTCGRSRASRTATPRRCSPS